MTIPYPPNLPDATSVMPKFWLGTNASCDHARQSLAFTCINVEKPAHTVDQRCRYIPVLGSNGMVDYNAFAAIQAMIYGNWATGNNFLIHGITGNTYSALTMALWLQNDQHISLADAYAWLTALRPTVVNLSKLAVPQATP